MIERREGKFYNGTDGIGYSSYMEAADANMKPATTVDTTVVRQEKVWVDADEHEGDFGYWREATAEEVEAREVG